MSKLTKKQFLAQFPYEVNVSHIKDLIKFDGEMTLLAPGNVKVYRILNLLLIKVDNRFYTHRGD